MKKTFLILSIILLGTYFSFSQSFDCKSPFVAKYNNEKDKKNKPYNFNSFEFGGRKVTSIKYSNFTIKEVIAKIKDLSFRDFKISMTKENTYLINQKLIIAMNCGDVEEKVAKEKLLNALVQLFSINLEINE